MLHELVFQLDPLPLLTYPKSKTFRETLDIRYLQYQSVSGQGLPAGSTNNRSCEQDVFVCVTPAPSKATLHLLTEMKRDSFAQNKANSLHVGLNIGIICIFPEATSLRLLRRGLRSVVG